MAVEDGAVVEDDLRKNFHSEDATLVVMCVDARVIVVEKQLE